MFNIILFNPQIPPNTGNIIRLCANTGSNLHLIKPYGFRINEKSYKRASLDYRYLINLKEYLCFENFLEEIGDIRNIYAVSKFGKRPYYNVNYKKNDFFLFGSETSGLPQNIKKKFKENEIIFIPMKKGSRSLNLSNSVSIVLYEAWRQLDFK